VVRSNSKIDEDWERKVREKERREYGEREREMEIRKKNVCRCSFCFFFKKKVTLQRLIFNLKY